MRGVFVSDLHLLAERSQGDRQREALGNAAAQSQVVVLGGDIFDFKWSQLHSLEASVEAALAWLRELVASYPECQFHFLLGNHDDHPHFVTRMAEMSHSHINFEWHPHHLRLGSHVFLHGHVLDRYPLDQHSQSVHLPAILDKDALKETHRTTDPPNRRPSKAAHIAYAILVRTRLHRLVIATVHRKQRTADRLARYLEGQGLGAQAGVTDVFFGHTHHPMSEYFHRGLRFHNGGAAIIGLPFRIIPWEMKRLISIDSMKDSPLPP